MANSSNIPDLVCSGPVYFRSYSDEEASVTSSSIPSSPTFDCRLDAFSSESCSSRCPSLTVSEYKFSQSIFLSQPFESEIGHTWEEGIGQRVYLVEKKGVKFIHEEDPKVGTKVRCHVDIAVDDVIVIEEPLIVLPSRPVSSEHPICINCGVVLTKQLDAGGNDRSVCILCKWPVCEKGCAEGNSRTTNFHSFIECSMIRNSNIKWNGNPVLYQYLWILRMGIMKKQDPVKFAQMLSLSKFEGHKPREYLSPSSLEHIRNRIPAYETLVTEEELNQIFKVLICKFRPMHYVGDGQKKLRALYMESSRLSHSCVPNVQYWTDENHNQTLVAVEPIKAGELLTISYDDDGLFLSTLERRKRLLQSFNIWCDCRRCSDVSEFQTNFSLLPCRSKGCFTQKKTISEFPLAVPLYYYRPLVPEVLDSVYECPRCHEICSRASMLEWEIKFENRVYASKSSSVRLRRLLQRTSETKKIHPLHFVFFRASWRLLELLSSEIKDTDFLDKKKFVHYTLPAEVVHFVFSSFLPRDLALGSLALRTVALIKLAVLTANIVEQELTLEQVKTRLESIYFSKERLNLIKLAKYHHSVTSSLEDPGFAKDSFDFVEYHGIDKFIRAVREFIFKEKSKQDLEVVITCLLGECE